MSNIDFIVIALPRSGTTWLSNLLTTDKSICLHDATSYLLPSELDRYETNKETFGICCTGAWLWKEWIINHPARVLKIERNVDEVNQALVEIGFPTIDQNSFNLFNSIDCKTVGFNDLFVKTEEIFNYLLPDVTYDKERATELLKMNIQPTEKAMITDAEYMKKAIDNILTYQK